MKRLFLALALFVCAAAHAQAGPYVFADVTADVDTCVYLGQGQTVAVESAVVVDAVRGKAAFANRGCRIDQSTAPVGTNNVTLAGKSSLWGSTSSAVPFVFTRPGPASQPVGTRLVP